MNQTTELLDDYIEGLSNFTTNFTSEAYDDYNYILDEEGNIICEELTEHERRFYANFAWWLEGIGQMTIGGIGFLANCIAIPILGRKKHLYKMPINDKMIKRATALFFS